MKLPPYKKFARSLPRLSIERLEDRLCLSASGLTVFAAGSVGTESMSLSVDGQPVSSWTNIGGDYPSRTFQAYEYVASGLSLDRIQIAFTNDGQTPEGDRNLHVDRVNLYGVDYQVEDASVFSVGSWDSSTGCAGGFKLTETLHCDGYFDFSSVTSGTTIEVRAAGATGTERVELQIDGATVQGWDNVGGDYQLGIYESFFFEASGSIAADQIRVLFANDGTTGGGQDRNLRVDGISLDGFALESEAASVFSTGTWTPADGCAPGFKQSEYLHCGGYLEFGGGTAIEIRAAGSTGTESMELQIAGTTVATWDDVGGDFVNGVFQTFQYAASGTVTADQIRVLFANDGVAPGGADRNLRVDGITVAGEVFESESDTVFSTGTWSSVDGCLAGFKLNEVLHCGGYLQFATSPQDSGSIALATNAYTVGEADGMVDVVIQRSGGSEGIVTVDYRSLVGTATLGSDYTPVSGRAIFDDGETEKTISIDILQDGLEEGTEQFGFSIDNANGGATLLAPRTAVITIQDDESPPQPGDGFTLSIADFSQEPDLTLNESAAVVGSALQLTPAVAASIGTVFYNSSIEFDGSTSFATDFEFQLTGGQGTTGADGLTFVLHSMSSGAATWGLSGGALGYGGLGTASFAVEFDTYQNSYDTSDNHVSVLQAADVATPLATEVAPIDLNGGNPVFAWIDYDGTTDVIDVFLSDTATKPVTPLLTTTIDLAPILGEEAYFGLTAATGGATNIHELTRWSFASSTELTPEPFPFIAESVHSGFDQPTAVDFSTDGRNLYIAEKGGVVHVARDGQLISPSVVDIQGHVNGIRDRGLLDIAVHPDLASHPYLYLLYTYDPPEVNGFTGLAGPDGVGNRAGRLTRIELDPATNYTTSVGSEVVLLGSNSTWDNFNGFANSTFDFDEPPAGILPDGSNLTDFLAADSESHGVGSVEFGSDGALYVSNGDGTSYNQRDPRTVRVQDIDNLSGKILRIDPITGVGLSDNPFYSGDPNANRSKVFHYGVRNPFRMTIDAASSRVYVGDVGWSQWEEVNEAVAGANFGWPYYEGANGVNEQTIDYEDLPEAQAFYMSGQTATPAILALNHLTDAIDAIVLGDIYTGNQYPPEFQGDLLVNSLGPGLVRNISFGAGGEVVDVDTFTTGAEFVVQMKSGPDGYMYFVDLLDGFVGRWVPDVQPVGAADPGASQPSEIAAVVLPVGSESPLESTALVDRAIQLDRQQELLTTIAFAREASSLPQVRFETENRLARLGTKDSTATISSRSHREEPRELRDSTLDWLVLARWELKP